MVETTDEVVIYVDADACPVKAEVFKVARRYRLSVWLVANQWLQSPADPRVRTVVVDKVSDAADDWIAARAARRSVVITADIPLAARCLSAGARVLGPRGRAFTEDHIGDAMASRALSQELREMGIMGKGAAPFTQRDRSRFLSKLDELIHAARRD